MNGWLYNLARGLEWEEKGQMIYRNAVNIDLYPSPELVARKGD